MLTFIKRVPPKNKNQKGLALYECHCGETTVAEVRKVNNGKRISCGCERHPVEDPIQGTKNCWLAMIYRCYNPKSMCYDKYGGAGITVCDRWRESYDDFVEDMGYRPTPDHSIHRIDNAPVYSKETCKWADRQEQQTHRTNTVWITYKGETKSASEWSRDLGIGLSALYIRIKKMSGEEAIERGLEIRNKMQKPPFEK